MQFLVSWLLARPSSWFDVQNSLVRFGVWACEEVFLPLCWFTIPSKLEPPTNPSPKKEGDGSRLLQAPQWRTSLFLVRMLGIRLFICHAFPKHVTNLEMVFDIPHLKCWTFKSVWLSRCSAGLPRSSTPDMKTKCFVICLAQLKRKRERRESGGLRCRRCAINILLPHLVLHFLWQMNLLEKVFFEDTARSAWHAYLS